MSNTDIARKAITDELKRRAIAKDPSVRAMHQDDTYRWHHPQDNYYVGSGSMDCPICKTGSLRYSRDSYNGHIHAACSTPICVRWME